MAGQGQAGRCRRHLQRPRAQLLPRQDADLRRRRRARIPQRRRRLGHPRPASASRRPRSLVAPDRVADRRGIRPHHLPGDAGRPRLRHPHGIALARPGALPGAHRAGLHQHRAVPAADARALLQARRGHRARHRVLGQRRARGHRRHRRPVAPTRRPARRIPQQGVRPAVHGQADRRPAVG